MNVNVFQFISIYCTSWLFIAPAHSPICRHLLLKLIEAQAAAQCKTSRGDAPLVFSREDIGVDQPQIDTSAHTLHTLVYALHTHSTHWYTPGLICLVVRLAAGELDIGGEINQRQQLPLTHNARPQAGVYIPTTASNWGVYYDIGLKSGFIFRQCTYFDNGLKRGRQCPATDRGVYFDNSLK